MTLSTKNLVSYAVAIVLATVFVLAYASTVKITVAPGETAKADGVGKGAQHISGIFIPDESNTAPRFGSASSPPVNGDCMEVNGVNHCYYSSAFNPASSTCQFKMPAATSTIEIATATMTNGRGTVLFGEWGKSRDVNSTSTSLGFGSIGATAQYGTIIASSTGLLLNVNPVFVVNANSYLTFKVGSTSPSYTGKCIAEVTY